ncbi:hypothetical protein [Tolypothrix sp. NIES-4075]|uniref:hypothetical protein n=1 Tax=Tolypothrix sp. NIES-4075 TaxID=2005459 RepID=UPI001180C0FA|nr:hypothetical protein [Tolypothrix sp. NIES-4075]
MIYGDIRAVNKILRIWELGNGEPARSSPTRPEALRQGPAVRWTGSTGYSICRGLPHSLLPRA